MAEIYPTEVVQVEDMDHDRLAAIGGVILMWNLAESALAQLIWALGNLSADTAELITTDLQTVSRITLARNLLYRSHSESEQFDYVDLILRLFDACREARNDIVHAQTYSLCQGLVYGKFSAKGGKGYLVVKRAAYSIEALSKLHQAIVATVDALHVLTSYFSGERDTRSLPEKQLLENHLTSLRSPARDANTRPHQSQ